MEKIKDKVGAAANAPVSFPRWREVLQAECTDPLHTTDTAMRNSLAWLKFLKAAHRPGPR